MKRERKVSRRPAVLADVTLLRHWDQLPHIIASKGTEDWAWLKELERVPNREQLIAEVEGRPIGFL